MQTTPDDPSQGIITGLKEACEHFDINAGDVHQILHGTTIVTNAVLEYDGVRTGIITTEGYRDILHIGRHQRPQYYSIMQDVPWQDRPLVRRAQRLTAGWLDPTIVKISPFERARDMHKRIKDRTNSGKLLLQVDPNVR